MQYFNDAHHSARKFHLSVLKSWQSDYQEDFSYVGVSEQFYELQWELFLKVEAKVMEH